MTREEVMRSTGPTSGSKSTVKIGARKDGTIVAAQAPSICRPARCRAHRSAVRWVQLFALRHPEVPVGRMSMWSPTGPRWRPTGRPGAPIGAYAGGIRARRTCRSAQDGSARAAAEERGEAGNESRARPGIPAHRLYRDAGSCQAHPHYKRSSASLQGRGVASGFWFNAGGESSATVNITEDGNVVVTTGHPDVGGSRAAIANICAELLGIDYRRISVIIGDTQTVGFSNLTGGSRVLFASAMVVTQIDRQDHCHAERAGGKNLGDRNPEAVKWETAPRIRRAPTPANSRR